MVKKILLILLGAIIGFGVAIPVQGVLHKDNSGITLHTSFKTEYYMGESLDLTGGILDYTVGTNTSNIAITSDMISGFTSQAPGTRQLAITYRNFTCTIPYTVNAAYFVEDNVVYDRPDYPWVDCGVIFRDNGTKLVIGQRHNKTIIFDIEDMMYSYDETFELIEKKFVNGKYELIYEYGYEYCVVKDITANGFHLVHHVEVPEYNYSYMNSYDFTKNKKIIPEEEIPLFYGHDYYSDVKMPKNAGHLSEQILHLKFLEHFDRVIVGVQGERLEFPRENACKVTRHYKGGKPILTFTYPLNESEYIDFEVYDITERNFMVGLLNYELANFKHVTLQLDLHW